MKHFKEHIVKHGSEFRLVSHKGKNLGTFSSHAAAAKHEGEVEWFKSHKEETGTPGFSEEEGDNKSSAEAPVATPSRNSLVDPMPPRRTESTQSKELAKWGAASTVNGVNVQEAPAPVPSYGQWKQNKLKAKLQAKHGAVKKESDTNNEPSDMSSWRKTFVADDTQMDVVVDPKAQPRSEQKLFGFSFKEAILQTMQCRACGYKFFGNMKGAINTAGFAKCPECGAGSPKLLWEATDKRALHRAAIAAHERAATTQADAADYGGIHSKAAFGLSQAADAASKGTGFSDPTITAALKAAKAVEKAPWGGTMKADKQQRQALRYQAAQAHSAAAKSHQKELRALKEAWEKNPNCAQCGDKLSATDKAKGTVCSGCVKGRNIYDKENPNDLSEAKKQKECPVCHGEKYVWGFSDYGYDLDDYDGPCPECSGTGTINEASFYGPGGAFSNATKKALNKYGKNQIKCPECGGTDVTKVKWLKTGNMECNSPTCGYTWTSAVKESLEYADNDTTPRSDGAELEYELKKNATVARNERMVGFTDTVTGIVKHPPAKPKPVRKENSDGAAGQSAGNNNMGPGALPTNKKEDMKGFGPMAFESFIREHGLSPDCDRCGAGNIYQGKSKTWKPGKTVNLCGTCWNADDKGE